uniref:ATP synthase F0 subunit 8 n=1 Tax=Phobaeticus serratipes TaxID=590988 RepID=E2RUZ9_9NEOP|nr:ATP synthase F0 subunit 8 [Phobaeticus serratipes]BAJ24533.1 ATP synthase F0 subunit 8 [Phobaeticus serratipes]
MPQMSPMSWLMIYMYFISMYLLFIMKIYFKKNNNIKMKIKQLSNNYKNNWKW